MSRTAERHEKVFVSMNSGGQVIITPAAANERAVERAGLQIDRIPAGRLFSRKIDTAGRLKLPADFAAFFHRP